MSLTISGPQDGAVIEPGSTFTFRLTVRDPAGRPAAHVPVGVSVIPSRTGSPVTMATTANAAGAIAIDVPTGPTPDQIRVIAEISGSRWEGVIAATAVNVQLMSGLILSDVESQLLRMLFWDRETVRVLAEFGGGFTGNRVLQVRAASGPGRHLTQVMKIGNRDEIQLEGRNYELFRGRLQNAAPAVATAVAGTHAAILYGDATAGAGLSQVVSFARYFADHDPEDVRAALFAVASAGLGRIHRYYRVDGSRTCGDHYLRYFPEDLVLAVEPGAADGQGVFPAGHMPELLPNCVRMEPDDVAARRGWRAATDQTPAGPDAATPNGRALEPGDLVALEGFRIGRIRDRDMNLEDAGGGKYRIRIHHNGAAAIGFHAHDRVDVMARFVTDHRRRLRFAVQHCLQKHGLVQHPHGWELAGEFYPDPLELLTDAMDREMDVAIGTIHGDLHWDNVMLEGPSNWWLIDYGLSRDDGPILFDFLKLESYLRRNELSGPSHSARDLLALEQDLLDDPFGRLQVREAAGLLGKGAHAIRAIRRLAERYMLGDVLGYFRMLFAYSVALVKYYPAEDEWAAPEGHASRSETLDLAARRTFAALATALVVGRSLEWERTRLHARKLSFDFVPMGTSLEPRPDTIVLDVGNRLEAGVIDHHHLEDGEPQCTTGLVWSRPDLVTDHTAQTDIDRLRWVVHMWPDFDCVAATYLAWHRAALGFFPPGSAELQRYAFAIDAGGESLESARSPERTPYALFAMHLHSFDPLDMSPAADARRMRYGFEVMEYLCRCEATGIHTMAEDLVPREHGFWTAPAERDKRLFDELDLKVARKLRSPIRLGGEVASVAGLVMESPRSLLFKVWARSVGYRLLVVRWLRPGMDHRIVVSVPPAWRLALQGLGLALEVKESEARRRYGKERSTGNPRWPDRDNDDPWYDGRSPVHAYTIVDAPRAGTVLSVDEVVAVVTSGEWLGAGDQVQRRT